MNKPVKYSLIAVFVLVLILVSAIVVTPYLLGVDKLRSYGEEYASSYLGRDVSIADSSFSGSDLESVSRAFPLQKRKGSQKDPPANRLPVSIPST